MPDYPHFEDDDTREEWTPEADNGEIPASVTFMEMMRQAAANAAPPPPDQLFAKPVEVSQTTTPAASSQVLVAETATPTAETSTEAQREEALNQQRILRVKKRRVRRRRQTVSVLGGIIRSFMVVITAAVLMATIFTWWTPAQFLADDVRQELSIAQATGQVTAVPTIIPTPNWLKRVGIVSGHRGPQVPPDPGAVCPDGLTEASITFAVSQLVVRYLRERGYSAELLEEFDPRLDNYQAAALVSIHANTCQVWPGEIVSGYLIARAAARTSGAGADDLLVDCVAQYYAQATRLQRREGVTVDMTDYHTFREIHPLTPAAIIELGFMLADRATLTENQPEMARGITDGILCFLEPGRLPATPTLPAEATP
jgi:N-acetylmuramoyl-L-alanine amidase